MLYKFIFLLFSDQKHIHSLFFRNKFIFSIQNSKIMESYVMSRIDDQEIDVSLEWYLVFLYSLVLRVISLVLPSICSADKL